MDKTYEQVIQFTIQNLMENVWEGVTKQKIAKKLALTAAKLESVQFMASYVQNSMHSKNNKNSLKFEPDPPAIPIDNFAYAGISKQTKQQSRMSQKPEKSRASHLNQSKTSKISISSARSQKQVMGLSTVREKKQNGGLITLPEIQDPHYIKDSEEDRYRNYIFMIQKDQQESIRLHQQRIKQRSQRSIQSKKMFKDLKKYTYDYEGRFFGIKTEENAHQNMLKVEKNYGEQSFLNRATSNPEEKVITNSKIKQREGRTHRLIQPQQDKQPKFNENRPQTLLDMFQPQNKISEGVKLSSQNGNEKIIKQRPRKLSGLKQYRLNQYQSLNKNKKFINFKRTSINHSVSIIEALTNLSPNQQQQPKQKTSKEFNSLKSINLIKSNEQILVLPPLKNSNIKKSKLMVKYSQSSRSILDQSGVSKKSDRSQVTIAHPQLYNQNFPSLYQIN